MKTAGYWNAVYVCSVCGEHSSSMERECPFCHSTMTGFCDKTAPCKRRAAYGCEQTLCDGYNVLCPDYEADI